MKVVLYQKNSEVWDFLFWLGFMMFWGSAFLGFSNYIKPGMGWHYQTTRKVVTLSVIVVGAIFMVVGHKISWKIQERELKKMSGTIIKW
jgi:hypothetical protein